MQLQMTAPLDIGLEQADSSLRHGQDDIFDLEDTEKRLTRKGGVSRLIQDDGDVVIEDSEEEGGSGVDEPQVLDEDEEKEKRAADLEAELEGLYDAYRERMREKDAKFKVKESRQKNVEREEWHGISKQIDGDDSEDGDDSDQEGGWDKLQEVKEQMGEDSSDDGETDAEGETPRTGQKRRRPAEGEPPQKRVRLVKKLEGPAPSASRAAQVWFSQDIFAGLPDEGAETSEAGESDDVMNAARDERGAAGHGKDLVSISVCAVMCPI
jgi:AdoMet-dependent rRNA methyltransferase SPB1